MPDRQQVVIGSVTNALAVFEDVLDVCVVKEALNKIAALLAVLMTGEKHGDLQSVIFKRETVSQQFRFLVVLAEIRNIIRVIEIVTA